LQYEKNSKMILTLNIGFFALLVLFSEVTKDIFFFENNQNSKIFEEVKNKFIMKNATKEKEKIKLCEIFENLLKGISIN